LSLTVGGGEVCGIAGQSGSGKSTLLNIVARLREFQAGTVELGVTDVRSIGFSDLRRSVGMVAQFPLFIDDTARANLLLARADANDGELESACRNVGVWDVLMKAAPPGSGPLDTVLYREANKGPLSGGQRRLFAIARALLNKPGLLILDEPTTGVDSLTRLPLEETVRAHSVGRTVMIVDQDMQFLAAIADTICCIERGRITDVVHKAEFFTKPSLFLKLYQASHRASEAGLRPVPLSP
jgi:ABC-type multidrug transport system fused ATPase/permease subunit